MYGKERRNPASGVYDKWKTGRRLCTDNHRDHPNDQKSGIVFDKVEIEAADVPFGIGSGSGVIFGVTGGVTEAVLRRLQQGHNRVDMEAIKTSGVRGDEGIKELTYNYNGRESKLRCKWTCQCR